MSLQSVVFAAQAGQQVKEDFAKSALAQYPHYVAAAFIEDGKLVNLDAENCDVETLTAMREAAGNDKHVLFWAAKIEGERLKEMEQPYVVLSAGDTNHIYAMLEGDFTSFTKTDSSFPPEYHAINDWVIPKIEALADKHGETCDSLEDVVKAIYKDLASTEMKKEFENQLFGGRRGIIAFMSPDVKEPIICLSTKLERLDAEWGWASESCGLGKAETKKPLFTRKTAASKTSAPVAGVPDGQSVSVSDLTWIKPDATISSNQQIKEWYEKIFDLPKGGLPPGMKLNEMLLKPKVQVKTELLEELKKKVKLVIVINTDEKSGSDSTKKPDDAGSAIPLPIMSPSTKSKVAQLFAKPLGAALLDHSSAKILTLEQINDIRSKHADWFRQMEKHKPTFAEAAKVSVQWPYSIYEDIGFTDAKAISILAWDHGCRALIAEAEVVRLKAELDELKGKQKPAASPVADTKSVNQKKPLFTRKAG